MILMWHYKRLLQRENLFFLKLREQFLRKDTLLTFDKDFGELAFRSKLPASVGVILFRIKAPSGSVVAEKVSKVISLRDDWQGHFTVVEEDKIRMRDLK